MLRKLLTIGTLFISTAMILTAQTTPTCHSMIPGQEGSLAGFVPFGANSLWNQDVSAAALDSNSSAIINYIGSTTPLHPDFGAGLYNGATMGIPYVITPGTQANVNIHFTESPSESEPSPMPIPATAPIEGYPAPGTGDRHVLVLNPSTCWLYELYSAYPNSDGSWNAGSAAVFDLTGTRYRPWGWTSADAAGLPTFAGLVRYDEILNGQINHALRFTLQHSRQAFITPARHWAPNTTNSLAAPMGMRLRLKASVDISGYSKTNQIILTALKKYGMIMADNGSNMYLSGTPDNRWNNDDLHNLTRLRASDFEVLKPTNVFTKIPTGAAPLITSFTSSAYSVPSGSKVTLSWAITGVSGTYYHVAPYGMVRGLSLTTTVVKTTTYTLTAIGPFGRTTATLTVSVP